MADRNLPTEIAAELPGGRPGPAVAGLPEVEEDVINRRAVDTTPRRYEQPLGDDDDPVMPSADSTLKTEI
jgi:hypothetical protein